MSEFITLYRRRQDIRFRMRKIKYWKDSQDEYGKLADSEKEISKRLDEIVEHDKRTIKNDKL